MEGTPAGAGPSSPIQSLQLMRFAPVTVLLSNPQIASLQLFLVVEGSEEDLDAFEVFEAICCSTSSVLTYVRNKIYGKKKKNMTFEVTMQVYSGVQALRSAV